MYKRQLLPSLLGAIAITLLVGTLFALGALATSAGLAAFIAAATAIHGFFQRFGPQMFTGVPRHLGTEFTETMIVPTLAGTVVQNLPPVVHYADIFTSVNPFVNGAPLMPVPNQGSLLLPMMPPPPPPPPFG